MLHAVNLIFGYDHYCGDINVSPSTMLHLLKEPFPNWLYKATWEKHDIKDIQESDFHRHVYASTSHFSDEDFYFDPKDAEWLGFRITLDQHDAQCEFEFTTQTINGRIRPDYNKIVTNVTSKLITVKDTINDLLQNTKERLR